MNDCSAVSPTRRPEIFFTEWSRRDRASFLMPPKRSPVQQGAPGTCMIPQPLERQALQKLHDDSNAGHLGFFKTYQRVHRRYFLQRLYSAVFKYVNPRQVCQRRKVRTPLPSGCCNVFVFRSNHLNESVKTFMLQESLNSDRY